MDNSSIGAGFMAVFAVSGSVVLLAHQIHKRLLSEFMKKFEFELVGSNKDHKKKKVRFVDDVATQPLPDNKANRKKHPPNPAANSGRRSVEKQGDKREFKTMPLNWQVMYKGIIESRAPKGHLI